MTTVSLDRCSRLGPEFQNSRYVPESLAELGHTSKMKLKERRTSMCAITGGVSTTPWSRVSDLCLFLESRVLFKLKGLESNARYYVRVREVCQAAHMEIVEQAVWLLSWFHPALRVLALQLC